MKTKIVALVVLVGMALNCLATPPVVKLTSTGGTVTLTPAGGQGVVDLEVNGGGQGTNVNGTNIIYISTIGSDSTGNGTMGNPFLTLTKATNVSSTFTNPCLIYMENIGVYTFTPPLVLTNNTSLAGCNPNLCVIDFNHQNVGIVRPYGLVINGNNVTLSSFTISSNDLSTNFYYPLSFWGGTNFVMNYVNIIGNTDGIDATVSNLFIGTANFCTISTGWDDCVIDGATASAAAGSMTFNACTFSSVDTVWPSQDVRGIASESFTTYANNCFFYSSNSIGTAYHLEENIISGGTNILKGISYTFLGSVPSWVADYGVDGGTGLLICKSIVDVKDISVNTTTSKYPTNTFPYLFGTFNNYPRANIAGGTSGVTNKDSTRYGIAHYVLGVGSCSNFDAAGNSRGTNIVAGAYYVPIGPGSSIQSIGSSLTSAVVEFY